MVPLVYHWVEAGLELQVAGVEPTPYHLRSSTSKLSGSSAGHVSCWVPGMRYINETWFVVSALAVVFVPFVSGLFP